MDLQRLIYVSRVGHHVRLEDAEEIARSASERNARTGITGFLLYSPEYFVQALEGRPEDVQHTFARIGADDRHYEVREVSVMPIADRFFADWHMGFAQFGRLQAGPGREDLQQWSPPEVLRLLQEASRA